MKKLLIVLLFLFGATTMFAQLASKAHYDVGKKIRKTIKDLGGTMPEDIPAIENIKQARKRLKDMEYQKKKRKK